VAREAGLRAPVAAPAEVAAVAPSAELARDTVSAAPVIPPGDVPAGRDTLSGGLVTPPGDLAPVAPRGDVAAVARVPVTAPGDVAAVARDTVSRAPLAPPADVVAASRDTVSHTPGDDVVAVVSGAPRGEPAPPAPSHEAVHPPDE
jgi:hypothetical protein